MNNVFVSATNSGYSALNIYPTFLLRTSVRFISLVTPNNPTTKAIALLIDSHDGTCQPMLRARKPMKSVDWTLRPDRDVDRVGRQFMPR